TLVTCSATDAHGNTGSTTFQVTVQDTTPPSFTSVPANITNVEAADPSGAVVSFALTATDVADPSPTINCSPASGSTFPLGTTTVDCSAQDAAGHTGNTSFAVDVVDTTPPAFSNVPSPITLEANNPGGSAVGYGLPTAVDLVSGPIPVVVCSP